MSLDFITNIPDSKGFNAILRIGDRYNKMTHFLSWTKDITSEDTTHLVMRKVFRQHGLPNNVIGNRGAQFISKFWKHLFTMLKVSCELS